MAVGAAGEVVGASALPILAGSSRLV
jgi:hypothetical protein